MKYDDIRHAEYLVKLIDALDQDIGLIQRDDFHVAFNSVTQNKEMTDAIRDSILGEVTRRKIEKLQELKKLGVDVSDVPTEPMTDWFRLDVLDGVAKEARTIIDFGASGEITIEIIRTGLPEQKAEAKNIRDAIDEIARRDL